MALGPHKDGVVPLNRRHPALHSRGTDSRHQDIGQSTDLDAFFHPKGTVIFFNSSEHGLSSCWIYAHLHAKLSCFLNPWPCESRPWHKDQAVGPFWDILKVDGSRHAALNSFQSQWPQVSLRSCTRKCRTMKARSVDKGWEAPPYTRQALGPPPECPEIVDARSRP